MIPCTHALQKWLHRKKIDAFLIGQPQNRFFLSGYNAHDTSINESSGFLLIPKTGTPLLLTDSRFELHAQKEAPAFEIVLYQQGLFLLLGQLIKKLSLRSLAFESHYFLYSRFLQLQKLAKREDLILHPLQNHIEKLRAVKSQAELEQIQKSVRLNEQVFQNFFRSLRPGITEKDAALQIENAMRLAGADRPSFDTIIAGGPNGALPHAVPSNRPLRKHEPIIIDMGLMLDGYCSDMTRTIVLGTPDAKTRDLFRLVRKAQLAGMHALRPGVLCSTVDSAARTLIKQAGYGAQFGHGLGHGVGLAVHESPSLNSRTHQKLRSGMVVTIEPGIYLPGWGGIRLENMAYITESGHFNLNSDTTFLDL